MIIYNYKFGTRRKSANKHQEMDIEVKIMLDERKLKVLYAIINGYISSVEPVGSRTISKAI